MSLTVVANAVERLAKHVGRLTKRMDSLSGGNTSSADLERLKLYVQSRGTGLITNGFGLLKDNTNFSRMSFDSSDAFAGFGCFTTDSLASDIPCDEFIPVNPKATYEFSFAARTLNKVGSSQAYSYLMCCDIDGQPIQPQNLPFISFRLAETLVKGGQPVVHADDIEKVRVAMPPKLASLALLYLSSSDYTSKGGFAYPKNSYTRTSYGKGIAGQQVKFSAETGAFTGLDTSLLSQELPAGTEVTITQSGGSYVYWISEMSNTTIPDDWTAYRVRFNGERLFRPFTAMVKIGWLVNRGSQRGNKQAFSAINFREVDAAMQQPR